MTAVPVNLLWRIWRVALPLVVIVCLTPSRVDASCGDYVTIVETPNPEHLGHTSNVPKPPCDGLNCSSSPTPKAPPLTTIYTGSSQTKELTQSLHGVGDPDTNPGPDIRGDHSYPRPVNRSSSVFHPPRCN